MLVFAIGLHIKIEKYIIYNLKIFKKFILWHNNKALSPIFLKNRRKGFFRYAFFISEKL